MKVYNVLFRQTRKVLIKPHKNWNKADSLLGILVRYENYLVAYENVLRIKDVHPNSPAAAIGLEPQNDYILGTSSQLRFVSPIESIEIDNIGPFEVFVYNSRRNCVWSNLLSPLSNWEKGGYLGCEFYSNNESCLPHIQRNNRDRNILYDNHKERGEGNVDEAIPKTINSDKQKFLSINMLDSPPNDIEIREFKSPKECIQSRGSRSLSFDLSKDLIGSRIKALHKPRQRKGSNMLIPAPFTDSGLSSLSFIREAKTLGNIDDLNTSSSPKTQSLRDINSPLDSTDYKKPIASHQNSTSIQTLDQSYASNNYESRDSHLSQAHNQPISLLSVSVDHNEEKISLKNQNENRCFTNNKEHVYFSKKLEGDYIIKNEDLFNIESIIV